MPSLKNNDSKAVGVGALLVLLVGGTLIFQQYQNRSASNGSVQNSNSSPEKNSDDISTLSIDVIRQKMVNNEKVRFLDFRNIESFEQEHIPHSVSLSPASLASFVPEKDELLIIVFSSQDTSALETIKNILRQKPFKAFLLSGGFEAWKNSGNQVLSAGDPNSILDQSKVVYITQEEIQNSDLDFILLDVQTPENYRRKHVAGALHIPLDQLEKRSQEIPATKNIVVYGENEVIAFQGVVRLSGLNIITAKALRGNTHLKPESIFLLEP